MNNFLSIVIPLYNKENSIGRAIESVLSQTYCNYELIIVNDGSTDKSLSVLKNYNDMRIKVFNIKNSGVSFARNFGISKSRSNYICLLDADDEWQDGFLYEINRLINYDKDASIYVSRYQIVNENGQKSLGNLSLPNDFFGKIKEFYKVYAHSRSLICSSCVCLNKDEFLKIGGFPVGKKTGEDIYVWLTLNLKGYTCFSSKVLATVYRNSENRTSTRVKREIPYHLYFYLFQNYDSEQKKLNYFCIKNCMLYAVDAKKSYDIKIYNQYLEMLKKVNKNYYFILLLIGAIPSSLIKVIKGIRNLATMK